jgi:hypothetical protein
MVELEVIMGDDLIAKTRDLAVRYFGDDGDESLARVLHLAFAMRCMWSQSVTSGQQEANEAVSSWESSESTSTQEAGVVTDWLFRR